MIKEKLKVSKPEKIFENLYTSQLGGLPATRTQEPSIINVGVVVPTLNEEKNIEDVLFNLKNNGYYNILVIDGMSKDKTAKIATRNGAKVVFQKGKGKGNAIKQGLNNEYLDADAIIMIDADGSMDPKEIPSFVEALCSGADIVKGSRFIKGGYSYDMGTAANWQHSHGNSCQLALVSEIH